MEAEGLAEIAVQGADEERAQLRQQRSVSAEIVAVLLDYFRTGEDRRRILAGSPADRRSTMNTATAIAMTMTIDCRIRLNANDAIPA